MTDNGKAQAETETPATKPEATEEILLAEIRVRSDSRLALHYSKTLVADMPDFLGGAIDLLASLLANEYKDVGRRPDSSLADMLTLLARTFLRERAKFHEQERAGVIKAQLPKILRPPAGAKVKH